MVFLFDVFPGHALPDNNCLLGTLVCSLALWKELKPIANQDVQSPAKVLEDYIANVRQMVLPDRFHSLESSNGFGYDRLSLWMDTVNLAAIEPNGSSMSSLWKASIKLETCLWIGFRLCSPLLQ